jgi:hypothetical protein
MLGAKKPHVQPKAVVHPRDYRTYYSQQRFHEIENIVCEYGCRLVKQGFSVTKQWVIVGARLDSSMKDRVAGLHFVGGLELIDGSWNEGPRQSIRQVLDLWAVFLPTRIASEDLGGYIEDINQRLAKGQRWLPIFRTAMAVFWTGANTVGYFYRAVGRQKST